MLAGGVGSGGGISEVGYWGRGSSRSDDPVGDNGGEARGKDASAYTHTTS
jgi:hypothetical protein